MRMIDDPATEQLPSKTIIKDITRFFNREIKEACWRKAAAVPGRDPMRWRFDAVGNIVCKKLTGCEGCLCYEHDHIVPHSKGGLSTLENCQILQSRVNRYKSNDLMETYTAQQIHSTLFRFSCHKRFLDYELDLIEISLWGNVKSDARDCRCKSWMELDESWQEVRNTRRVREFQNIPNCETEIPTR